MVQRAGRPISLAEIAGRFSAEPGRIRRLVVESEHFRPFCEEYGFAIDALKRFEKQGASAGVACQDYRAIVRDLEQEVVRFLDNENWNDSRQVTPQPPLKGTR